jgi:hypothetical protein
MKEYLPIIVSVIAGLFSIGAIIFTWIFKQSSEKQLRKISQFDELKDLYIRTYEIFEEPIKVTNNHKENDLNSRFSKLTAEINMLAPIEIIEKYKLVLDLYEEWANLYIKAYPPSKNGYKIIYSKSIDPTLKYKESEKNTYEIFYKEYNNLCELMRSEIKIK